MHIFTGSLTPRFSLALIAPPLSVRSCWSSSPGLRRSWFSWASFFSSGRFFQVHSLKLAFKTQVIPSWVFRRTTVSSVLGPNTFKLKLFYSSDNSQVKQTSLVQRENYQHTKLFLVHKRPKLKFRLLILIYTTSLIEFPPQYKHSRQRSRMMIHRRRDRDPSTISMA